MPAERFSPAWDDGWPAGSRPGASTLLAMVAGVALAFLIVLFPLPGMLAPAALAALVMVVRRPEWLMLAFAAALAVPIQKSLAGIPVNACDGLLVLWALLWPLMMARREAPPRERWSMPAICRFILPFLLAALVSQAGSINPSASVKQVARLVEWFVLLPLVMMVLRPDDRTRLWLGTGLMVIPVLFALDGVVEYFNHGRSLTGMLGIPVPVPEGGDNQIRHTFDISGRAGSTFGGAQGLAMYLVMSMSVALAHLAFPPRPWMRPLAVICLIGVAAGLAVAKSRGGLLGALAVLLAMGVALRPGWRFVVGGGLVLVLGTALLGLGLWPSWDGTVGGLIPGRPEAVLDRLIIWGKVLEVMQGAPFFGVGLGNFRDAFFASEAWLHVELAYPSLHAHNTYLELLADTGWVGLLCYLFFMTRVLQRLRSLWRERLQPGAAVPVFTLAALGSLAAYAVFAAVDMLLLQNMHMLLVMLLGLGLTAPAAAHVGDARSAEMNPGVQP